MRIQCVCTSVRLWLAAATLAAMPVWADGELDKSFGTNGVAILTLPVQDISTMGGITEAVGMGTRLSVVRLSPTGTVMGSPQISPQNEITALTALVRDSVTGDIWAAGYRAKKFCLFPSPTGCRGTAYTYTAQFARFSATGALIASYEGGNCVGTKIHVDQNGPIAVCVSQPYVRELHVVRLNTEGGQLNLTVSAAFSDRSASALLRDGSSGAYYIGGYACNGFQCKDAQYVMRLEADSLAPDTSYAASGVAQVLSLPIGDVLGMALDNSARIVLGGSYGASRPGYDGQLFRSGYLARLTGTGVLDPTFGAGGVVQGLPDRVIDVATDVDSKVYALDATVLRRFNIDGGRDSRFASGANAQNFTGGSWRSMRFADSSRSSAYLLGSTASGASMVAKVLLKSSFVPYLSHTTLRPSETKLSSGQAVTFTATVTGSDPTGSVMFMDGTELLTDPITLTSGTATYSTSALAPGSHSISAVYDGDSNNGASASPTVAETVYVLPVASTTALSSSAATITSGEAATFTATVTGFNPTGTVTFTDGSATLGNPIELSSGSASLTTTALAAGTHSIAAVYGGDTANAASASQPVIEAVKALTRIALATSAATIVQGESITLTATVTGSTPTGTVAFMDGSGSLGAPVGLSAGSARLATAGLAVGSHSIIATYSGDAANAGSTSPAVTETVTTHATSGGSGGGSVTWIDLVTVLLLALARARCTRSAISREILSGTPRP
jgi:hypothetical protein